MDSDNLSEIPARRKLGRDRVGAESPPLPFEGFGDQVAIICAACRRPLLVGCRDWTIALTYLQLRCLCGATTLFT
jgi:hypothetical protein